MEVRINSETNPISFDNSDEAKNFVEKRFREFEDEDQEKLEIEIRK